VYVFLFFCSCTLSRQELRTKDVLWLRNEIEKTEQIVTRDMMIEELALRRDPMAIPHLCRYTSSQDIDLRHQSLTALNSYGGAVEGRDEIYIQLLSSKDGIMRRGSVEGIIQRFQTLGMIPFLYAALERIIRSDTNWQSRLHAVEVLEWVQDSDVLLLEAAQRDENTTIRARAISALGTEYKVSKRNLSNSKTRFGYSRSERS
jgi:hypothetical protein